MSTAPGKLILMGEHAAVYGRPAVVAALGLRTRAEIAPAADAADAADGVELDLVTLGHREHTSWEEIDRYTTAYASRWRRFDREPDAAAFAELVDRDPGRVVKLALGETRRVAGVEAASGIRLRVVSEIPVGSGFGSSASVAVAVAAALLGFARGTDAASSGRDLISEVALEVERRQHGRPSGVDHATVLRGGVLRVAGGADRRIEPLALAPPAAAALRVFDTGRPAETTGEVVAAVRARHDADPGRFTQRLESMAAATRRFGETLVDGGDERARLEAIRFFERRLEGLGVVPDEVRAAVRRIEELGGAAKVSGAGTLSGASAGALLVCWPAGLEGRPEDALAGYPCHRAAIGAPGLTIEEAA